MVRGQAVRTALARPLPPSVTTTSGAGIGSMSADHALDSRPAPMPLKWTHILFYKPQETLVVSYNTVKTHVSHVYAKLGVHSQQELIDVVESGA